MKRMLIVVITMLLAGSLFADEAILIDFTQLAADIRVREHENDTDDRPNQNRHTLMDFSHVAGGSFTAQQRAFMRTSLAIENWEITLASSARHITNMSLSYTREAPSRRYGTVMGVRVHFPVEPHNSWAMITPPFEIPAFEPAADIDDEGNITPREGNGNGRQRTRFEAQEDGEAAFGVVKNVATIRSVAVNVHGLNFPHTLSVILIDGEGNRRFINMGHLRFDGWGELIWTNPQYIQEVRNRDIRLFPLYPVSTPFVKFGGFLIQRDAAHAGGDFITYFRDVRIIYDRAVLDIERDIDDEAIWNIIQTRETARKAFEMQRFGQNQVLRHIDRQLQSTALPFGHPDRQQEDEQ